MAPSAEKKFVIERNLATDIRDWARVHLGPDPHGTGEAGDRYTITSLYFDTEQFHVLRREGSFARGKYRVRRYGSSELVFLERKMKGHGLVRKRRTQVHVAELPRVEASEAERDWPGYWYHRRILARRLSPVCQISYSRIARVSDTPTGPMRLTLDDQIAAVPVNGLAFDSIREPAMLSNGHVILELKYHDAMPALFERLIGQFELSPQPASKYRIAGAALGFGKEYECLSS